MSFEQSDQEELDWAADIVEDIPATTQDTKKPETRCTTENAKKVTKNWTKIFNS